MNMTAQIDLRVVDVRKSFVSANSERLEVLRGISLSALPGEAIAITGASGSGKSTLLHLLGGLDEVDHGSITLGNSELGKLRGDAASRFRQHNIGFVFQFHYLMTDLSTVENVAMPLLIRRLRESDVYQQARSLLTDLGLAEKAESPVSQLSGGEQQRVALARALISCPALLLADEPTGNLDEVIGNEIGKTLINHVRSRGSIAIVATHNKELAALCNRVMLLEGGRLHEV
jgi:lipoprotein-releasing system ATP-binding protein